MRSHELLLALEEVFKKELDGYLFPSDSGEKPVQVFLHSWPQDQLIDAFPSIVIRWAGSEMEEDGPQFIIEETIAIGIGVYAPKDQRQAGILLAELNDAVLQILHKYSNRLVANRFERSWPILCQQPEPDRKWSEYHAATIVTKWDYPVPVTPLDDKLIVEVYNNDSENVYRPFETVQTSVDDKRNHS